MLFTDDQPALVRGDPDVGVVATGEGGGNGFVKLLVVDPAHRRRGHGRALLDAAEADLAGLPSITVGTDAPFYLFPGVDTRETRSVSPRASPLPAARHRVQHERRAGRAPARPRRHDACDRSRSHRGGHVVGRALGPLERRGAARSTRARWSSRRRRRGSAPSAPTTSTGRGGSGRSQCVPTCSGAARAWACSSARSIDASGRSSSGRRSHGSARRALRTHRGGGVEVFFVYRKKLR